MNTYVHIIACICHCGFVIFHVITGNIPYRKWIIVAPFIAGKVLKVSHLPATQTIRIHFTSGSPATFHVVRHKHKSSLLPSAEQMGWEKEGGGGRATFGRGVATKNLHIVFIFCDFNAAFCGCGFHCKCVFFTRFTLSEKVCLCEESFFCCIALVQMVCNQEKEPFSFSTMNPHDWLRKTTFCCVYMCSTLAATFLWHNFCVVHQQRTTTKKKKKENGWQGGTQKKKKEKKRWANRQSAYVGTGIYGFRRQTSLR